MEVYSHILKCKKNEFEWQSEPNISFICTEYFFVVVNY